MKFKYHLSVCKENRLESSLKKKKESLASRWLQLKETIIEKYDNRFREAFPTYTEKLSLHGKQGRFFFSSIISQELMEDLGSQEIFLLLAGSYLHDIGNISESPPYRATDHESHFELGQNFIRNKTDFLSLSKEEREVIGKLCRWHNYDYWLKHEVPKENDVKINEERVRVQLLIELLQLSDFYHHVFDLTWQNSRADARKKQYV